MFNAKKFLDDYHISYWTDGKNCQKGWINITCPFCDDTQNHGGFNLEKGYYNCWKCGHHWLDEIIKELLGCSRGEALRIIKLYQSVLPIYTEKPNIYPPKQVDLNMFKPKLSEHQKEYLSLRNFDPDYLQKKYSLMDSGYIGEYNFRIIAPIYLHNKLVSFQGRTYFEHHIPKYMACKKLEEIVHHKNIVYNHDNVKNRRAIIVEGITDVWRIGDGAVALFGQNYTTAQINFIIKNYDEVFILLDIDAQRTAHKLALHLAGLCKVNLLYLPMGIKDPGELSLDDIRILKKSIKF